MTFRIRVFACVVGLGGLLAFLIGGTSHSQTAPPGEDSYFRGQLLANKYECVRAIEEFDKAINANPNDPRYYLSRANCRVHQLANANANGDDPVAASVLRAVIDGDLSAAIRADPKYALVYFERAKARQLLMRHAKADSGLALSDFDKALELEPGNYEFLRERAHFLLIDLKDEKRGLEDMALLIKRQPKEAGHYFVRGRFFAESERFPEAIQDISTAIKLGAYEYWVRAYRAEAYFRTKNYGAALADLNRILAQGPGSAVPFLELRAKVYRATGKNALALADERRAKRLDEKEKREFERFMKDPE